MKTPRWSILWIALLLGIATGDAVLQHPQEEMPKHSSFFTPDPTPTYPDSTNLTR